MAYKKFDPAIADWKTKNTKIFRETISYIKAGGYTTPSGRQIQFDYDDMLQSGKCFHNVIPAISAPILDNGTKVMVEGNDCLKAAERLVSEGYNPILLNFASAGHPGGGVETGARAQEETICRRSTLVRSIYSFDDKYAARYGFTPADGDHYPIVSEFSAVYSPSVTVFREGIDCTLMENPFNLAVVTCAALNLNGKYPIRLTPDGHMPPEAIKITRNKIRTVFRIGLTYGHDSLVLGAFGCGAFHNPPAEIAHLFHEVMEESEFKDRFKLITFSIINDHNSNNANLQAFQKEFENEEELEEASGIHLNIMSAGQFADFFTGMGGDVNRTKIEIETAESAENRPITADEKRFRDIIDKMNRTGTETVFKQLELNGFFTAPASVHYHGNYSGGLLKHSLAVYDEAMKLRAKWIADDGRLAFKLQESYVAIAALLHDVCKCDNFTIGSDGKPRHKQVSFPIGHGEKSVIMLLSWGFNLTQEEMLAIRWHMGSSEIKKPTGIEGKAYEEAIKHPLCKLIVMADYNATH